MPSASTTFPKIQLGSFTPPAAVDGIKWLSVTPVRRRPISNVTGSNDAGTQDTARKFLGGLPFQEFMCQGVILDSSTFGLAQTSTLTVGTLTMQMNVWTFRKMWPLDNITGPASTVREWMYQLPVLTYSGRGVATGASGPVSTTNSITSLTLGINQWGSLALTAGSTFEIERFQLQGNLATGGAVPCEFAGYYSGPVTYTAGGEPFSWLFPTPDAPVKGTLTLNTNGETFSPSVLAYDFSFMNPSNEGGAIRVSARFRTDKT